MTFSVVVDSLLRPFHALAILREASPVLDVIALVHHSFQSLKVDLIQLCNVIDNFWGLIYPDMEGFNK